MFYALIIAFAAIELLLQIAVLPFFDIQNVFPHLIFVTLVMWLVLINFDFSVGYAIATGFILDLYSRSFVGGHIIAFVVTLFVLKLISEKYFPRQTLVTTSILGVIGIIIFQVLLVGLNLLVSLLGFSSFSVDTFQLFAVVIPLSVLWVILLTAATWRFFQKVADVIQYFQHRARNT